MALQIEHLFHSNRFQDRSPVLFVLLLIYFPIGVIIMTLRVLISLQYLVILAILPKGWLLRQVIMRMYLFLIGILVTADGAKNSNANIVVSNYATYLDSIAIEAVYPTQRLGRQTNLPGFFKWLLGFREDDTSCMGLEAFDYEFPISFFPEEDSTSGKCALLKFAKYLFKTPRLNVQPVVILAYRPNFFPVNVHCLTSTFWSDLMWTLFFPCTKFHVSYLPEREIPNEDDKEAFVNQLEEDIASVLSIKKSVFTAKDKSEYMKRAAHERTMREQLLPKLKNTYREINNQYSQMAKQVKVVLPQVPMSIIEGEISKTKNVDMTISNFLDGSVKFNALTEEEQQNEKQKLINKKKEMAKKTVKSLAATSITSKDHHLSFQEKKELMIEDARARYLEVHPEYA